MHVGMCVRACVCSNCGRSAIDMCHYRGEHCCVGVRKRRAACKANLLLNIVTHLSVAHIFCYKALYIYTFFFCFLAAGFLFMLLCIADLLICLQHIVFVLCDFHMSYIYIFLVTLVNLSFTFDILRHHSHCLPFVCVQISYALRGEHFEKLASRIYCGGVCFS